MTRHKKKSSKRPEHSQPQPVTAEAALARMKSFSERKERFVAAIKKSKD